MIYVLFKLILRNKSIPYTGYELQNAPNVVINTYTLFFSDKKFPTFSHTCSNVVLRENGNAGGLVMQNNRYL
jgi:hypothetical protein